MHRSDYAEKQLRIMQQIDKDHTLTQLANAWLNLAVGGSKIQEAYLIFQYFSEKYQMTSLILNGKAVCCVHMGNFDEAESLLLEALNKGRMSEAELGAHSIKSHGASVARNHMHDWLIAASCGHRDHTTYDKPILPLCWGGNDG